MTGRPLHPEIETWLAGLPPQERQAPGLRQRLAENEGRALAHVRHEPLGNPPVRTANLAALLRQLHPWRRAWARRRPNAKHGAGGFVGTATNPIIQKEDDL